MESSFETLAWMRGKGVRSLPLYGRQSFEVDGKVRFWGGLTAAREIAALPERLSAI